MEALLGYADQFLLNLSDGLAIAALNGERRGKYIVTRRDGAWLKLDGTWLLYGHRCGLADLHFPDLNAALRALADAGLLPDEGERMSAPRCVYCNRQPPGGPAPVVGPCLHPGSAECRAAQADSASRLAADRGAALARVVDVLRRLWDFTEPACEHDPACYSEFGPDDRGEWCRRCLVAEVVDVALSAPVPAHAAKAMAVVEAAKRWAVGVATRLQHARGSQADVDLAKALAALTAPDAPTGTP